MPHEVVVELGARSYSVHIGRGLLGAVGAECRRVGLRGRCLVVSDTNVAPLYADAALASLREAGFAVELFVVPAGEGAKSRAHLGAVHDAMFAHGMDRRSFAVALGGGVVGDLAGFGAATFLRGVDFVGVPTTVLAMVDSSVGGKTGINVPQGKNLVGAFHQPRLVLADLDALTTLPAREIRAGMAEVVKYGAIWDAAFFRELEAADLAPAERVLGAAALDDWVARCCAIKAEVVRQDEREGGLRAILNFGHTVGHAVERTAGYGTYLHGEAVAVGMAVAARAAVTVGLLPAGEAARLEELLRRLGLPVRAEGLEWPAVEAALAFDKKSEGGVPKFVLVGPLGTARAGCELPPEVLRAAWSAAAHV